MLVRTLLLLAAAGSLAGCGFREGDLSADNSRKTTIILDPNDPCLIHVASDGTVWDTEFAFSARIEGCKKPEKKEPEKKEPEKKEPEPTPEPEPVAPE